MRLILRILGCISLIAFAVPAASRAYAQQPAQPPATEEIATVVSRDFGPQFKIAKEFAPMFADFNRDGQEDLAIVVTGDNPLMNEGTYRYKVADPYNASFGFGDPKVTLSFSVNEDTPRYLLISHTWRSPEKKFVIVNVPFKAIKLGNMLLKKKAIPAVSSTDISGVQGAVYWDGRKYKWEAVGMDVDR